MLAGGSTQTRSRPQPTSARAKPGYFRSSSQYERCRRTHSVPCGRSEGNQDRVHRTDGVEGAWDDIEDKASSPPTQKSQIAGPGAFRSTSGLSSEQVPIRRGSIAVLACPTGLAEADEAQIPTAAWYRAELVIDFDVRCDPSRALHGKKLEFVDPCMSRRSELCAVVHLFKPPGKSACL